MGIKEIRRQRFVTNAPRISAVPDSDRLCPRAAPSFPSRDGCSRIALRNWRQLRQTGAPSSLATIDRIANATKIVQRTTWAQAQHRGVRWFRRRGINHCLRLSF
jgi:hypothetical protein